MCHKDEEEQNLSSATAQSFQRKTRKVVRRTNKFASMTKEDMKDANRMSKRDRGLSRVTYENIFGRD